MSRALGRLKFRSFTKPISFTIDRASCQLTSDSQTRFRYLHSVELEVLKFEVVDRQSHGLFFDIPMSKVVIGLWRFPVCYQKLGPDMYKYIYALHFIYHLVVTND